MENKPFATIIGQMLLDEINDAHHQDGAHHEGIDGLSDCSHHDHPTDQQTSSPSHSAAASLHSASAAIAAAPEVDELPSKVCTFHLNGLKGIGQGCLRVNCNYFHGTEGQLADLRQRAALERERGGPEFSTIKRVKRALVDTDLGDKRAIVCLAYLSNSCRRPGCRFLHLPPNIRPLPIAVCDRNLRGVCTLRHRCRFYHGKQEDLSRMHAEGVTMYNPFTFEPHDPSTSVDELMKLQTQTTVPLSAATMPPPPPAPQQPVYVVLQANSNPSGAPYPFMVAPNAYMFSQMMPFAPNPQQYGAYPQFSTANNAPNVGFPLPPYSAPNSQAGYHPQGNYGSTPYMAGLIPRY